MRFTLRCTSAARFPIASEATASTATACVQRWASCGNAVWSTRNMRTRATVFVAADMNAVTVVGALVLYLDFINLFLFLLRFLGGRRK